MNRLYTIDNAIGTAPENNTLTGTVSSEGFWLIGTATEFFSEINVGDWIVNEGSDECLEVRDIKSDVLLQMHGEFTSDLSSATLKVIPRDNMAQYIIVENNGAAQGSIDGQPFRVGSRKDFGQLNPQGSRLAQVKPMVIDATGTQCDVVIQKP